MISSIIPSTEFGKRAPTPTPSWQSSPSKLHRPTIRSRTEDHNSTFGVDGGGGMTLPVAPLELSRLPPRSSGLLLCIVSLNRLCCTLLPAGVLVELRPRLPADAMFGSGNSARRILRCSQTNIPTATAAREPARAAEDTLYLLRQINIRTNKLPTTSSNSFKFKTFSWNTIRIVW